MQERQEAQVRSLRQEDLLEEGMATHSSILSWRIPGTEEPGRLAKSWTQLSTGESSSVHLSSVQSLSRV